jgi:hypothetical protein
MYCLILMWSNLIWWFSDSIDHNFTWISELMSFWYSLPYPLELGLLWFFWSSTFPLFDSDTFYLMCKFSICFWPSLTHLTLGFPLSPDQLWRQTYVEWGQGGDKRGYTRVKWGQERFYLSVDKRKLSTDIIIKITNR